MRVNITGTKNKVEGCHTQTTDYGTREWSILLSPLAKPKRHRKHADDHGARGHDDGPQPGEPGGDRSLKRRFTLGAKIIRKGHERIELAVATPIDMIAPIRDGTLNVV